MAANGQGGPEGKATSRLLEELAALRELDERRQRHAPGSADHDASTVEVDRRNSRLMDLFRDLTASFRREGGKEQEPIDAGRTSDAERPEGEARRPGRTTGAPG